mmetsp:Transcript_14762/g.26216  ORF Transcript_14762/g.26216 Transcript_14762/m.26216 type:complete len:161 (-) Transcript_14762:1273-1755(-)
MDNLKTRKEGHQYYTASPWPTLIFFEGFSWETRKPLTYCGFANLEKQVSDSFESWCWRWCTNRYISLLRTVPQVGSGGCSHKFKLGKLGCGVSHHYLCQEIILVLSLVGVNTTMMMKPPSTCNVQLGIQDQLFWPLVCRGMCACRPRNPTYFFGISKHTH